MHKKKYTNTLFRTERKKFQHITHISGTNIEGREKKEGTFAKKKKGAPEEKKQPSQKNGYNDKVLGK